MDTQNQQNGNQNSNQNGFERNKWFILALVIILAAFITLFNKNFHFEAGFNELSGHKQDTAILKAIKDGDKDVVGAIKEGDKRIADKIDTTNKILKETLDTLKEVKKDTRKIADKNCCTEKPPCPEKTKKPAVKPKPCPEKKPVVKPKPKVEPCKDCDTTKKVVIAQKPKCEYILWNPDHTKKKIFYSAEARKKFADEHGLIIHVED